MKVSDLQANTPVDEITVEIVDKELPREVKGGTLRVCTLRGKDETGDVAVTLWNDDIEKVTVGDSIKISEGWVGSFQDKLQLGTGRRGSLEVVKKASESTPTQTQKPSSDDDNTGFIDGDDVDLDISEEKL